MNIIKKILIIIITFLVLIPLSITFTGCPSELEENLDEKIEDIIKAEDTIEITTEEEEEEIEPIMISGIGTFSTDFFEIKGGMTIFEFIYEGESNYRVSLYDKEGNTVDQLLVCSFDSISGRNGYYLPKGKYYLGIYADDSRGLSMFVIKQPQYVEVKELPYTFKGNKTDITDLLLVNGLAQVNFTYKGSDNISIWVKNKYGKQEEATVGQEGPCEGSITFKGRGEYLILVDTKGGDYVISVDYK